MASGEFFGHRPCSVGAAVIDDHDLPVGEGLGDDALDCLWQKLGLHVARDDD